MKRIWLGIAALAGFGLSAAAGTVLVHGVDTDVAAWTPPPPVSQVRSAGGESGEIEPVIDVDGGHATVRVVDPVLVLNSDGSTAVGAQLEGGILDVALMDVSIWVDRFPIHVTSTEMWLPVLAGERSQVGAASDAGGFLVPTGISDGTHAEVAFRFDDGTCVLTTVVAVARTNKHRMIYPRSNRTIGPETVDDPQSPASACDAT
ncbi:hypothetical protein [Aeromicrobium fastidiosum]|uniref:Uncharacterized protein n=1 Tax=Aeromicrobium fastidiosum TaxID=52699 RepID=A0A641ANF4_9ACTN|nr:hypothetical protein [Aeromicrobium fastidiosum]KAA1376454.1 hypothetical protein ESP62_013590 [Aeromicrobium fastidiosum]MBP2391631.1 hypothetical protein [Aeromicrobium fastidiosum]